MAYAEVKGFASFTRMSLRSVEIFLYHNFFYCKIFPYYHSDSLLSIRETWQDFSKRGHTVSNKGHSPDCPPCRV